MNNLFTVDENLCASCGQCVRECGHHVRIQSGSHVDPDNPRCVGCYHCYTICPQNAIHLRGQEPIGKKMDGSVSANSLADLLASRRSIRRYLDKTVDDETVGELMNAARYIPSGGNAHSYEFTILQSDESKARVREELLRIYKTRSAVLNNAFLRIAALPFVNAQMRGFLLNREYGARMRDLVARIESGDDPFFYRAPLIVVIHSAAQIPTPKEDCVLAGYNISLMAQAKGLGACFVTLAQNAFNGSKRCKAILGLSPRDSIHAVVVLGYPAAPHLRIAPKPGKAINRL